MKYILPGILAVIFWFPTNGMHIAFYNSKIKESDDSKVIFVNPNGKHTVVGNYVIVHSANTWDELPETFKKFTSNPNEDKNKEEQNDGQP
jgi:hypothetical protein